MSKVTASMIDRPEESGWVIVDYRNGVPWYWAGGPSTNFVPADEKAIRFCRSLDANRVVCGFSLAGLIYARVEEHIWAS